MAHINNMDMKYGFIGCGHLGLAFVKSLICNGFSKENIYISYIGRKTTYDKILQAGLKDNVSTNDFILKKCDCVFLFIRPYQLENIENSQIRKNTVIISSIAGVSIQELEKRFKRKIIRIIPTNSDSIINENGVCAIYPEDSKIVAILTKIKLEVNTINEENEFHAFTTLSVLPAIIIMSEILGTNIHNIEIISKYKKYDSIISWSFRNYPKNLNSNEKKKYIVKTATPGGITEAMINDYKENKKIINAIETGIIRSQEIEKSTKL